MEVFFCYLQSKLTLSNTKIRPRGQSKGQEHRTRLILPSNNQDGRAVSQRKTWLSWWVSKVLANLGGRVKVEV